MHACPGRKMMPAGPATDARFMVLADNVVEFSHQSARLEVVTGPATDENWSSIL